MAVTTHLICKSAALVEGRKGVRFALPRAGGEGKGFAIRFDGVAHGFVNVCPHAGTELDWQPGEFFEESGLYLVCATHGALFEPDTGLCIAGPCQGMRLQPLTVEESHGQVRFHESAPDP
jgi:nitrite reductase/ring-hydroxylating ferredoxin subunit